MFAFIRGERGKFAFIKIRPLTYHPIFLFQQKSHLYFQNVRKRWSPSRNMHKNMIYFVLSVKTILIFPENTILLFSYK